MNEAKYQLLSVLQETISQDYSKIRQAEETLKQWEDEHYFVSVMQDIFYDQSIEHDIRFLSGIYLKNGLVRFWGKNTIGSEEKQLIRQRILQFVQEPSKKLAMQNAIIAAKIARLDYPNNWPELFPTLIQSIEFAQTHNLDQARLIHYRILEILSEILATRISELDSIASDVFQAVARIYFSCVDRTVENLAHCDDGINQDMLLVDLTTVSLCIKCLRTLMVNNIKDFHKYDETKIMVEISLNHLDQFMRSRATLIRDDYTGNIIEDLENIVEEYGLLYLAMQKEHPISATLCPAWLDVLKYYWQNIVAQRCQVQYEPEDKQLIFFEQHLLQGLLLVKNTIKLFAHKSTNLASLESSLTEDEKRLTGEAVRIIQEQFSTQEFVHNCAETIVTMYMKLTEDDLSQWDDDPEEFANDIDAENWEFQLRPCAEITFKNLLDQYADQLAPIILDLVERMDIVTDQESLLLKDAVYATIGLGVHSLSGKLDFESFIINRLVAEVVNNEHHYKILRRRIAWILGKWVSKDINLNCKRVIYEMFIRLMAKSEDLVVRLTAAFGLKQAVDDYDFDTSFVLSYLGSLMASLLNLVNDCQDPDTTLKLISTVNTIMDKSGPKMAVYAPQLIQLLVPLWSPTANPLLQSSLVITFTKLTSILNERSFQLQPILIPILSFCINLNNEAHIYLLEDSLDLWWTVLRTTPMSSPFMMPLLPNALELLDYDTDNLEKLLSIIESYVLLDPQSILQPAVLSPLFTKLASKILTCEADHASSISRTVDLILQSGPIQLYGDVLVQSGLLTNILNVLLQRQLYEYAIMSYMNIFARLTLADPSFVAQTIQLIGQQQQMSEGFLHIVLDSWINKFQSINQKKARKLSCLGFTNLLSTREPAVLSKLPEIMNIWKDVGSDLTKNTTTNDSFEEKFKEDSKLQNCAEKLRRNMVYQKDPVYAINLIHLIRQTVNELSTSMLLNQVDVALTEQIKQFLQ